MRNSARCSTFHINELINGTPCLDKADEDRRCPTPTAIVSSPPFLTAQAENSTTRFHFKKEANKKTTCLNSRNLRFISRTKWAQEPPRAHLPKNDNGELPEFIDQARSVNRPPPVIRNWAPNDAIEPLNLAVDATEEACYSSGCTSYYFSNR